SRPSSHVSTSAPSTANGTVSTTAIGNVHFSNCAASSRNTTIKPKMNADDDVLPDSFSCSAWPAHAYAKSPGKLSLAAASMARIACPELYPGAWLPVTLTAGKPLKRVTSFGEATYRVVINPESGTLAPLLERT